MQERLHDPCQPYRQQPACSTGLMVSSAPRTPSAPPRVMAPARSDRIVPPASIAAAAVRARTLLRIYLLHFFSTRPRNAAPGARVPAQAFEKAGQIRALALESGTNIQGFRRRNSPAEWFAPRFRHRVNSGRIAEPKRRPMVAALGGFPCLIRATARL